MANICMHYIISGRVQGVWYRDATQKQARQLGITGWVKNVSNGDVAVMACGEQDKIAQLENWLWQGPILAKVDAITGKESSWKEYPDFTVS